jgi:hypothetical protein
MGQQVTTPTSPAAVVCSLGSAVSITSEDPVSSQLLWGWLRVGLFKDIVSAHRTCCLHVHITTFTGCDSGVMTCPWHAPSLPHGAPTVLCLWLQPLACALLCLICCWNASDTPPHLHENEWANQERGHMRPGSMVPGGALCRCSPVDTQNILQYMYRVEQQRTTPGSPAEAICVCWLLDQPWWRTT